MQGVHLQKQNMVFFGAAGIAGRPCLHAIVSRSAKLAMTPLVYIAGPYDMLSTQTSMIWMLPQYMGIMLSVPGWI